MPYTTLALLTLRYGEAALIAQTDRADVPTGVVDGAVVDRAIADAEAVIDGYLAPRYALPLTEVPPQIADIAATVAWWKLHRSEPDPKVKLDYEAAMRTLRDIADGRFRLPLAGIEPAAPGTDGVRMTDRERPLTEANMKGFI